MVEEKQAHQLACLLHLGGERVVGTTRTESATGMIMAQGHHSGIAHDSLLHDYPHVDSRLGESAARYAHLLDELEILVHQQHPSFLHVQVLHHGVHLLIYGECRIELHPLLGLFHLPALAQFAGCQYGDGLSRPNAIVFRQVADSQLSRSHAPNLPSH